MTGKISEDTAASALTGLEIVPVVQSGNNRRTTVQEIRTFASTPTYGGFWLDGATYGDTPNAPVIQRMRDRVFLGNAVLFPSSRSGALVNNPAINTTWLPRSDPDGSNVGGGATWAIRDAQLGVMHERGGHAIVGMTKASLGASLVSPPAPIGVAGFLVNDGTTGWGLYSDLQHEASATGSSYGLEVAAKNKGASVTPSPYSLAAGVYGLWLAGGGDNAYGGAAANPGAAAIVILKNDDYGWNRGIVFESDALTDSGFGTSTAISMGVGQTIQWESSAGQRSSLIRSDVDIAGRTMGMVFDNFTVYFPGHNSVRAFSIQDSNSGGVSNGVNYTEVSAAATGVAPSLSAKGTDTDIDLALSGKGAGVVQFGTRTAIGAETVSGYITIKDSGGTTRKLAVVS